MMNSKVFNTKNGPVTSFMGLFMVQSAARFFIWVRQDAVSLANTHPSCASGIALKGDIQII
jgi:hypothetical protein